MSLVSVYKLILMRHESRKLTTPEKLACCFGEGVGILAEELERMRLIRLVQWDGEIGYSTYTSWKRKPKVQYLRFRRCR